MRQSTVLLMFFLVVEMSVSAQHFSSLYEVKLNEEAAFNEYTDQVFDCCYYLLQTPFNKKDKDRTAAIDFITRWVKGTSSYSLKIDDNIKEIIEEREDLLSIYTVCCVKEMLEYTDEKLEEKSLRKMSLISFMSYCSNASNKVKMTKKMKKIMLDKELALSVSETL